MDSKIKSKEMHDRAYVMVRDKMPVGEKHDWTRFLAEYAGIEFDESEEIERYRSQGVRFAYKEAINKRAEKEGQNWRLFYNKSGKFIHKLINGDMVHTEVYNRMGLIASGLKMVMENLPPMIAAEGIEAKDRRLIKEMFFVSQGAALSISGSINQMKSIDKKEKMFLIEKLSGPLDRSSVDL